MIFAFVILAVVSKICTIFSILYHILSFRIKQLFLHYKLQYTGGSIFLIRFTFRFTFGAACGRLQKGSLQGSIVKCINSSSSSPSFVARSWSSFSSSCEYVLLDRVCDLVRLNIMLYNVFFLFSKFNHLIFFRSTCFFSCFFIKSN